MAEIRLNYEAQIELVNGFKNAGAGMGGSANVTSSSSLPTARQFLAEMKALSELLKAYSDMISKDCTVFKTLADNIKAADKA